MRLAPPRFKAAPCIALALLGSDACRRSTAERRDDSATSAVVGPQLASQGAGDSGVAAPSVLPARCHGRPSVVEIPQGANDDDIEIGDAVPEGEGYIFALVHRTAAGRTAAVGRVARRGEGARIVDLGPTLGDAPPPRLFRVGRELWAAAYGVARGPSADDNARPLVAYAVSEAGASPRTTLPQQRDDSLAFDVAGATSTALVAWDEASAAGRGVIRVAVLGSDAAADGGVRAISPSDRDTDSPRLARVPSGFEAVWIAHRAESPADGHALGEPDPRSPPVNAGSGEALGEPRAHAWLESVALDEQGAPRGAVRELTPATGHVQGFDLAVLPDGAVLVVARDDGEASDGSGGTLERVRITPAGADPPLAYPTDGLGGGAPELAPDLSARAGPWLSWVGPREQLRILPLDSLGAPMGPPSAEDALSDGRPLLAFPSGDPGGTELLSAFPSPKAPQLRTLVCAR